MNSGIYCIENIINNKKYIGKSVDINSRFDYHKSMLRKNKHDNDHLQKSWNKYGENNFLFNIIEECSKEQLVEKEIFYIKFFDTQNKGYNMTKGGDGTLGRILSDETKIKISNSNKGKIISDKTKKRMSENHYDCSGKNNPWYGKKLPESIKKKMSENHYDCIGENNPKAVFKEKEILDILELFYTKNIEKTEIIKKYSEKCSPQNINHILKGESWKHIYNMFMKKGEQ